MIEIFDRSRTRVAIAENAHKITENQRINAVWYLNFSLPYNDPKNEYCKPFYYVRNDGGELYRIMPETLAVEESGDITYQCEHVLATLIDNVLFGYHVAGNRGYYTADVIRYILDRQLVKNWVLDECDFKNQFEYGWEQETLLSALFSVAAPLKDYMWVTNTSVYPWRLSLKRIDPAGRPEMYVRRHHNMTRFGRVKDPQDIVTRLYPLGYGEGINQLGIASVNGGVPYLQSPKAITDKYGIIERVWIDRRYEDASSLKAAAEAMLAELQEPSASYVVGFEEITGSDIDKAAIGKRLRIVYPEIKESVDTVITQIDRTFGDDKKSSLTVANKPSNIAATVADMADRQRIESSYAQGATQIYAQALQANGDTNLGAVMDFFIPEEMRIVNRVLLKVRLGKFRAYSKATTADAAKVVSSTTKESQERTSTGGGKTTITSSSGGGSTYTSSSGGASTYTSSAGGGDSYTSSAGGRATKTSSGGGGTTTDTGPSGINVKWTTGTTSTENDHSHTYTLVSAHQHAVKIPDHTHTVDIPNHSHAVNIPDHTHRVETRDHTHKVETRDHTHKVEIPEHTHKVTIPAHDHKVTIPEHSHNVTPGIFEFGNPQKFDLYVNGKKVASFTTKTAELDITAYLTNSENLIPRGSWISVEARPDDLAYISLDLTIQGFIQSRGDKTV